MRFGIIGAGYIAPINTRALLEFPETQIVGIANRTAQKAEALREKFQLTCPVFTDYNEMLRQVRPDAVVINLYNDLHKECFLTCARAGVHILVEKPLANTYEDCLEMMAAAEKYGIRAFVLQTQRYSAGLQTLKAYITQHAQELGQLLSVTDQISSHYFYPQRSPWHLDPVRSGGGILLNYGVHQLDRIHWLMGQKTVRIHGQCLTKKPGVQTLSSYSIFGVTDRGIPYTAVCNGYSNPGVNDICLVYENGTVRCSLVNNGRETMSVHAGTNTTGVFAPVPLITENGEENRLFYAREMEEALAYLTGQAQEAAIPLSWGAEMVRLCCLAWEDSQKQQHLVNLNKT